MQRHPLTKKIGFKEVIHGKEIEDPYRWLENDKDPEVKEFINQQNRYVDETLDKTLIKDLNKKFIELSNTESRGSFAPRKGRYFFQKREKNQDHFVLYYRKGLDREDIKLIDPNKLSKDGSKALASYMPSKDGKKLAFWITESGSDRMVINTLDVDTQKILKDFIPPSRYNTLAWLDDNSGFYYSKWPEPGIDKDEYCVYFHKMGTDHTKDIPLFGKGVPAKNHCSVSLSFDNKYLVITVQEGWNRNDIFIKDLKNNLDVKPLIVDKNASFYPVVIGETVYMFTNYKAPKLKMVRFNIANPEESHWEEVIPEQDSTLQEWELVNGKWVLLYLRNAHSVIEVRDLEGKFLEEIKLPELGTVSGMSAEIEGNEVFFGFSSITVPFTIFRYDVINKKLEKKWQYECKLDLTNLQISQVWYKSKDSTKMSMFIAHKKDIKQDGNNPVVLDGYGGFGISMTPEFTNTISKFLLDGGVFAIANIRGGGEYGEEWHKAGVLEKKQNVFDDFIAAAEWLINKKYTNENKIAIWGGSNGGLLVGACITQRPKLYKAAICGVPVLDMMRFHKFDGGVIWVNEYGNPDNKKDFDFLIKYSPYHNVKKGIRYPSIFFVTADTDTRVNPSHARKMAARMQECNASKNPILLRTEHKAGHGFGKSKTKTLEDAAYNWAFVYQQLGIESKR